MSFPCEVRVAQGIHHGGAVVPKTSKNKFTKLDMGVGRVLLVLAQCATQGLENERCCVGHRRHVSCSLGCAICACSFRVLEKIVQRDGHREPCIFRTWFDACHTALSSISRLHPVDLLNPVMTWLYLIV